MTIYAIVNEMAGSATEGIPSGCCAALISASGILQGGNPYFVPDFSETFEARLSLAVRIGKLGKGISPRFAHRYVDSIAPCVLFVGASLLKNLRQNGLPWTGAISYDRCAAIGRFEKTPYQAIEECTISLELGDGDTTSVIELPAASLNPGIGETIAALSRDNTLKTGDIILLGLPANGPQARPDTTARLALDGKESLRFNIR